MSDSSFRNEIYTYCKNQTKEFSTIDYMGNNSSNIFPVPILEYTAKSMHELKSILSEIIDILSTSKFFSKLWLRGQRQEYFIIRSHMALQKMGLSDDYRKIPSLIPSLGRSITPENFSDLSTDVMYWIEAFKIWTLVQSNEFKKIFFMDSPLYKKIIKCLEPQKMALFMYQLPYDISEYIYHQSSLEELSEILAMQQYGGYTSMLDITDDLDVALFFTQSYLNPKTQKYELCNPRHGNIIYIIAQGGNTISLHNSSTVFKLATNDGILDLPPRIANQKCGLLMGANNFGKNTYAYRIIAKIYLDGTDILTTKTVNDMFPDINMDTLYKTYYDARPRLNGLYG